MSRLYIKFTPRLRFEPETIAFLNIIGVPEDSTVYYAATAFEITGDELWDAVDAYVVGIKDVFGLPLGFNNLSTIFKFIYPFIGGTATAHKYNLVDVTAFQGTFFGGVTHSGGGALFGGVNGYMDTNCPMGALLPAAQNFDGNNNAFGIYSRTNVNALELDVFCADGANSEVYIYSRYLGNLLTRNGTTGTNHTTAVADSLAHTSVSRVNNTEYKAFKRGVLIDTYAQASTTHCAEINILLGSTGAAQYTSKEITNFYGGLGMLSTYMSDYDAVLDEFQTTLNRNV